MKRVFYSALLVIGLSVSAFAADNLTGKREAKVSATVQAKFSKDFPKAEAVTWQVTDKFQKAYFTLNGISITAFYNLKDEYVATTHLVKFSKLPAIALSRIGKRYRGFMIKSIIQYTSNEIVYFVNLKKDNKELLVRVMPDNNIYLFQKLS